MQVLLVFLSVAFALSLGAKLPLDGTQNFNIHQRIFGGKDAHKGQFPYIVSMHIRRANESYICGGSIIDHTWILTAAHCIHNADWVKIFYGSTTLWNSELSHVVYSDNIIEHENYDNGTHVNDIALIRTPRVEYSELINKVSLADRGNDYEGAWAVASGWGEIAHNSISKSLQFVGLQIDRKSSNTIIRSTTWDGTSCGRGDSGGPLVTQDDPKLIGITSTGIGGYLTNFCRVSAYLDWIRSHTGLEYKARVREPKTYNSLTMQVLLVVLSVTCALSHGAKLPLGGTQNFDIQQRIQKGKDAHKGQFPYIVSLAISKKNRITECGGSIIDNNWILTAAHCTHNADWVEIFYGSTKYEQGEFSHVVGSDNIIEHENYDMATTHVNDIALIRTPRVEYSELVNKVSLADRDNDYVGAWAIASGWGKNEYGRKQENLQFIDLQIHSKMNCWNYIYKPSDTIICVGPFVGEGDSGGPLVTRDDPKLVGVTSFLDPGRLSGFSRVSSYLDWIRKHTGLQ
ncbi:uncharacterized protein LOC132788237 [Drosophila nasuta]|uniref:uncharacterized protein LOC132788237 n=1 Tax=Drosophila nasuta TaxID=42062 RepID=UPI00295E2B4E|nr:uncharacterized protein LOC132788237 [Drosophila nasuta]